MKYTKKIASLLAVMAIFSGTASVYGITNIVNAEEISTSYEETTSDFTYFIENGEATIVSVNSALTEFEYT